MQVGASGNHLLDERILEKSINYQLRCLRTVYAKERKRGVGITAPLHTLLRVGGVLVSSGVRNISRDLSGCCSLDLEGIFRGT